MEFKKFELSDIEILTPLILNKRSISCENTLANLAVWSPAYEPEIHIDSGDVYIKIEDKNGPVFSLMLCSDLKKSVAKVCEYCYKKGIIPQFLVEDDNLAEFSNYFSSRYFLYEVRNAAEYIYKQSDLALLGGKKYHSKRNHISSFSKKYNWHYEPLTQQNSSEFLAMADEWYFKNQEKLDEQTEVERDGIHYLVKNMSKFGARGGLIRVEGKVVAITLGTPINENIFDIMFEKALPEYSGSYAVINNEFAKTLNYDLINREEDLGIEGLRKAKLSYKPYLLLRKYIAVPNEVYESSKNLHLETFEGETEKSADSFVSSFFGDCFFIQKDGKIISQLFVIDAELNGGAVGYIYAAATDKAYRKQGLMQSLIEKAKSYYSALALRPASEELYSYYEKFGFKTAFYNKVINSIETEKIIDVRKITDLGEFVQIRNSLLPSDSLNLCQKALRFVLEQYVVYAYEGKCLAVFYKDGDMLSIRELLCDGHYDEFINSLLKIESCQKFVAYMPSESAQTKGGMICPDNHNINYLGLALD